MTLANDDNLFDGVTAIADAGGLDGFAREVLAECKYAGLRLAKDRGVTNAHSAFDAFTDALSATVLRRLDADMRRDLESAAKAAISRCRRRHDVMREAERLTAIVNDRYMRIINAIAARLRAM